MFVMTKTQNNGLFLFKTTLLHNTLEGEGHSRNGVFFEIANEKVRLS